MTDIYISQVSFGEGLGTEAKPFVADSTERFDSLMREHAKEGNHVHVMDGHYKTAGIGQWTRTPNKGFIINGQITLSPKTIIELDVEEVKKNVTSEPIMMFCGQGVWDDPIRSRDDFNKMSPEEVFAALPRGQAVRGGTIVGNFSKLQPIFKEAGKSLRIGGILLHGYNTIVDGVTLLDFGAYRHDPLNGAEGFPVVLAIASSGFDQNKLARLDNRELEGEPSHITNCIFDGYVEATSNDQVTVFMIVGSFGEPEGFGSKNYKYLWRRDCYQKNNVTKASGKNSVQAHCIYNSRKGSVSKNKSYGCDIFYYSDYLQSEGVTIELNEAYGCRDGVVLQLSPTPVDLARDFYCKDITVGLNKFEASGTQVVIRRFDSEWIDECRKVGVAVESNRSITGIKIDKSLKVYDETGLVEKIGEDRSKKRGCL